MRRILFTAVVSSVMLTGAHAFADDAMKSDSMSSQHKQMMKDCMASKKAMDSGMSKDDMKSACMTEMHQKMKDGEMSKDSMSSKPH